jgi:hypothetical protein
VSSEGGSLSHASYHVGTDWLVRCSTYADRTPILSFDAGPAAVSISTKGTDASLAAVEFARALAREAQRFADEIERMLAAKSGDNRAAGSHAA